MKTKQNSSTRALALKITIPVTLISLSAALVTFAAAPPRKQIQQKSAGTGIALQSAHRGPAVSESLAPPKQINSPKSAVGGFSASRQRQRSARQAHSLPERFHFSPTSPCNAGAGW